jgi:hypothetical protein
MIGNAAEYNNAVNLSLSDYSTHVIINTNNVSKAMIPRRLNVSIRISNYELQFSILNE